MKRGIKYWSEKKVLIYRAICFGSLFLAALWGILVLWQIYEQWNWVIDTYWNQLWEAEYYVSNSLRGFMEKLRSGTTGFTLCESFCVLVILYQTFYLKKITLAYMTLKRLPRKHKVLFELYKIPAITFVLAIVMKLLYVFVSILFLKNKHADNTVIAVLKNIWRIIL